MSADHEFQDKLEAAERLWAEGPRTFQVEGGIGYVNPFDNMFPYVSKRLGGTAAAKFCKEVPVTRAGVTMTGHLIESAKHEREVAARAGMYRE